MAELPTPEYLREGHHLDPGPFALDLYRLLCMALADQRVAGLGVESPLGSISFLQDRYLESDVIRILTSTAVALRILFDQTHAEAFKGLNTNCGTLWPNWPKAKRKHEVLNLREACNKIIHTAKIHYQPKRTPGPFGGWDLVWRRPC